MSESWKGQKLLPRAEFHVGAHITKFLRLQLLPTSADRTITPGSDKTNRFGLLFGTLDGSIGCIAPLDELTFRRLQSLQKKLVDAVSHVAGLNPRSFRHFHSNGKAHRPGPDTIVDCELLSQYVLSSILSDNRKLVMFFFNLVLIIIYCIIICLSNHMKMKNCYSDLSISHFRQKKKPAL